MAWWQYLLQMNGLMAVYASDEWSDATMCVRWMAWWHYRVRWMLWCHKICQMNAMMPLYASDERRDVIMSVRWTTWCHYIYASDECISMQRRITAHKAAFTKRRSYLHTYIKKPGVKKLVLKRKDFFTTVQLSWFVQYLGTGNRYHSASSHGSLKKPFEFKNKQIMSKFGRF